MGRCSSKQLRSSNSSIVAVHLGGTGDQDLALQNHKQLKVKQGNGGGRRGFEPYDPDYPRASSMHQHRTPPKKKRGERSKRREHRGFEPYDPNQPRASSMNSIIGY